MTLIALKKDLLATYHAYLEPKVRLIEGNGDNHQNRAKAVNDLINQYHGIIGSSFRNFTNNQEKQQNFLVLQYCTSVVSLEYRHRIWPYEYMALSRRVGELWERFCSAAWDHPSRIGVSRIAYPSFSDVARLMRSQITSFIEEPNAIIQLEKEVEVLFDLIGDINMKEDEVFTVDGVPHVIDFKSGFGSNEKGNTIRLQTVGKAYKLWSPDTKLLFLVRQQDNNNYLNVIRRSGLWDVRCGADAYNAIDELTGSNINQLRSSVINFEEDLSTKCWSDLCSHLSDLTSYLRW
jgi:hypothetical protein